MIQEHRDIWVYWIRASLMAFYALSLTIAGLSAIHFISKNPAIIGPFALMIGMTPLVDIFIYSLPVPGYYFVVGLAAALMARILGRTVGPAAWRWSKASGIYLAFTGSLLFALFIVILVGASAYYNIGFMDRAKSAFRLGSLPTGWCPRG